MDAASRLLRASPEETEQIHERKDRNFAIANSYGKTLTGGDTGRIEKKRGSSQNAKPRLNQRIPASGARLYLGKRAE